MHAQNLATIIIVAWAVIVVALERKFPYTPGQKLLRTGFFTDFAMYTLFHSWWLGMLIAALIQWVQAWEPLRHLPKVSAWPFWAQYALFFVTHDLYIYWFHRLQHHNRILWRTHEAHHSVKDVDWVAGSRSHAVEILINQTIEFAPIALLGGAPELAYAKAVTDAVWGMWIHANINVKSGWLQHIINGPEMHRWHHGIGNPRLNFATKLAIWDWMFGTAYNPQDKKPRAFGFTARETYPEEYSLNVRSPLRLIDSLFLTYFRQHIYAFRALGQRSTAAKAYGRREVT